MKTINYSAKVLPDGHLSLPEEIIEKLGLAINSTVEVTLKLDRERESAVKAFGAWSERKDIKDGAGYLSKIREEWIERTEKINNV
jgi:bifunctional DNA-binding transcriptional regulator/antitoxin component of YhaV-PrlF toxin-antitoxin module